MMTVQDEASTDLNKPKHFLVPKKAKALTVYGTDLSADGLLLYSKYIWSSTEKFEWFCSASVVEGQGGKEMFLEQGSFSRADEAVAGTGPVDDVIMMAQTESDPHAKYATWIGAKTDRVGHYPRIVCLGHMGKLLNV